MSRGDVSAEWAPAKETSKMKVKPRLQLAASNGLSLRLESSAFWPHLSAECINERHRVKLERVPISRNAANQNRVIKNNTLHPNPSLAAERRQAADKSRVIYVLVVVTSMEAD